MKLYDFDSMMRELLDIDTIDPADVALNGLQVERADDEIGKVAFSVDASMESIRRAGEEGADLLFVHHGLFWRKPCRLTGRLYRLVELLIKSEIALYAVHLPLDMHEKYGNNAGIAAKLGLRDVTPFGEYHGLKIGFMGRLEKPLSMNEVEMKILEHGESPVARLPFGKDSIETVGIVSGGAPEIVSEAVREGLDLFITGDASHTVYHEALEGRMNVLFAGHYATETWGVRLLRDYLKESIGLEALFIDIPTGL